MLNVKQIKLRLFITAKPVLRIADSHQKLRVCENVPQDVTGITLKLFLPKS